MRGWRMIVGVGVGIGFLAGCQGSSGGTPAEACQEMAAAWCARFYECFSPDQIAAAGLPVRVEDCTRDRALEAKCDSITPANACSAGLVFDPAAVDTCVGALGGVTCSQLDDPDAVEGSCEDVCTTPDGCAATRCDPSGSGCGAGACRLDATCGARCMSDVGDGEALATCGSDADCAEGYLCAPGVNLCVELCSATNACGPGRACIGYEHPDVGVTECSDGCRPGHRDCPGALTCVVTVSPLVATFCTPAGTRPEGATCTQYSDCAPPLACLADENGVNGQCLRFCDDSTPCAGSRTCFDFSPPLIYDGHSLGACL